MTSATMPDGRPQTSAGRACDTTALRAWLAGRWAILFSHPDDFAQEQLEMDRWLSIVSRSFAERDVAAVIVARPGHQAGHGWLGRLAGPGSESAAALTLDTPPGAPADLAAGALRAQMTRHGPRCALIVDPHVRCRRALGYRLSDELPSPLELIGWAVALRKQDRVEVSSEASPSDTRLSPGCDGLFYRCSGRMIFQPSPRWA